MWKFEPEVKVVAETKWIRLENLKFIDETGRSRSWDRCVRTNSTESSTDAVIIVATTEDNKLILVQQFRPALGKSTLELPAGLIDDGESPLEAGIRELREETGYVIEEGQAPPAKGEVAAGYETSPILSLSPGLTRETCKIIYPNPQPDATRGGSAPSVAVAGLASPEEDENITLVLLPLENLLEELDSYRRKNPEVIIFEGLYMFALGMFFRERTNPS